MNKKDENYCQSLSHTVAALLGKEGCPWDKKQNNQSIIKYLKAETEELVEALEKRDYENICEELGDVLFILLLISSYNNDKGRFDFNDVLKGVNDKLIRRHPHVFAGTSYESEEELVEQWARIKAQEKASR